MSLCFPDHAGAPHYTRRDRLHQSGMKKPKKAMIVSKAFALLLNSATCCGFAWSPLPIAFRIHQQAHSVRFSALHASKQDASIIIEGIVDDFDRLDNLHKTIQELRRLIPVLLSEPLTREQAEQAYTLDTRLTAGEDDIELASSLEELMALSNTFLLAVTASTRAGNLLSNLVPSDAAAGARFMPRVESKVILVPSDTNKIIVEWETEFFSLTDAGSNVAAQLIGYSELEIDPTTSKISKHRLLRVQWNGQEQDAKRIGQSLATLRRSVKSIQESPLLKLVGSSPVASILDQVRSDLFQQLSSSDGIPPSMLAPIFVKTNSLLDAPTGLCAMEDYEYTERPAMLNASLPLPLPGSAAWSDYTARVQMVRAFVKDTIPTLSQPRSSLSTAMFAPTARLITLDDTVLVQDADRLVNFYQSLAAWRQRTLVQWKLEKVQVLQWNGNPKLQVDYLAETNAMVPGAASVRLRGTDIFTLSPPDSREKPTVTIQEIRQTKLSFGDSMQRPQESSLFFRSLATAAQTGRIGDDVYDGLWNDFLQRLTGGSSKDALTALDGITTSNIQLSDAAATTVYRFMDALLTECPRIVEKLAPSRPPGYEYTTEHIALLGYLGETLLRGKFSYERSIGFSMASLKAAIRSGQLVSEKKPEVKVELTSKRAVKLSMTLFLKVPPLINLPGLDPARPGSDVGVPLKVGIVSEYAMSPESGMVDRHQLLESRINGQLTPGDNVSRWIQRQRGVASTEDNDDTESFMRGLFETVNWVRSLADGEKK